MSHFDECRAEIATGRAEISGQFTKINASFDRIDRNLHGLVLHIWGAGLIMVLGVIIALTLTACATRSGDMSAMPRRSPTPFATSAARRSTVRTA